MTLQELETKKKELEERLAELNLEWEKVSKVDTKKTADLIHESGMNVGDRKIQKRIDRELKIIEVGRGCRIDDINREKIKIQTEIRNILEVIETEKGYLKS